MDKAKGLLIKGGIEPDHIHLKIEEKKESVARDILSEVENGKYDTVIVGRRGLSGAKGFFSGSVSSKIVHHAKNCAVWVVE
jgi:nucleotide-binding universal stress UspA family protein